MDIKGIVAVMDYVHSNFNSEKVLEENLKDVFGKEVYYEFTRFSFDKFAYKKREKIYLTIEGVHELYRLKTEQSRQTQTWLMIVATIVVAISAYLQAYTFILQYPQVAQLVDSWFLSARQFFSLGLALLFIFFGWAVLGDFREWISRRKK